MSPAFVVVLLVALSVACAAVLVALRDRRRLVDELRESRQQMTRLQERVAHLSHDVERARAAVREARPPGEYLITTAGEATTGDAQVVGDRVVLSATVGQPLVRVAAFAFGLRRALSAEARNRIAFEVRREVRRARKQRRREERQTLRDARRREAAA